MNPDGSIDNNQFRFTGADDGSVLFNDKLLFTADQPGIREYEIDADLLPVGAINDTLKFSGVRRFKLTVKGKVVGGSEDCIDINHCQDLTVLVDTVEPKGRNVLTLKGGSVRIAMIIGRQIGHGSETDYDAGNWSDQSSDETRDWTLGVSQAEGVIIIRCLNATAPTLTPECVPHRYIFPAPGAWYHGLIIPIIMLLLKWHIL